VERAVVVCVFEPIIDTDTVAEEVSLFVALDVAEPVEQDVPVFDDDILEVAVADVIRLRDIGGDLDTDVDPVEERVPRVENDWVPLEDPDLDDATERDTVDEAVLVLVVLIEAVIVFVMTMVLVGSGELVPVFVIAMVIVC
jgi:hypothetical protein